MKTIEPTRELIPLKLIEPWARNPRGGELREMESFADQLYEEGIREDVHVFRDAQGVLRLMQGHRRRKAAEMILERLDRQLDATSSVAAFVYAKREQFAALWAKVWPFDESEAFLHLITMQQGADPFDARELAKASRTAMEMGIEKERLIGVMHRSAETVQLYLDLGTLPHRVQEAVYRGKLALGTAGLMRQLSKEQMELAMDGVLNNPITQEPMTEGQARVYIENQFLKPERWRKKWAVESIKLKRKMVADGMDAGLIDVVEWEDREQFVMSEALPQSAYALCEEHIEDGLLVKPGEPMTWGALALSLGVPWHLAPAMARKEEHVLVVKVSAVKDADSTSAEKVLRGRGKAAAQQRNEEGGMTNEEGEDFPQIQGGPQILDKAEDLTSEAAGAVFDEVRWRKVHGALMLKPEAAMQNALWEALMGSQWEALAEILPSESYASLMGELNRDGVKRKGLRWCLLACVALALCAEDEEGLGVVEGALGTAE